MVDFYNKKQQLTPYVFTLRINVLRLLEIAIKLRNVFRGTLSESLGEPIRVRLRVRDRLRACVQLREDCMVND